MEAQEIRAALQDVSPETLADALAIVFTESPSPSRQVAGMDKPNLVNFAQAIIYLKRHYGFEELEHFTTEADLVYVTAGERRILLTDRDRSNTPLAIKTAGISGNTAPPAHEDAAFESEGERFSNLEI
jgi:hypothetical protein